MGGPVKGCWSLRPSRLGDGLALALAVLLASCSGSAGSSAQGDGSRAAPDEAARAPAASTASAALAPLATCSPTGGHSQYAAVGIACAQCHPCGAAPYHAASWMDPASAGFHASAANAGLATCQPCHGAALDGVGGSTSLACAACHGASWKTTCTMCHGGADNQTGAPPRATWGNAGDPVRVGTHTAHVAATHGLSPPIACGACHVTPADALAAGHLDQATATVTFGGLAVQGGAAPTWNRGGPTCAGTYCHGATLLGGGQQTPVWTVADGTQRACTSCHGAPPPAPHPASASCDRCHPGYTPTSVVQATHVDGRVDYSVTCASCHGDPTRVATPLNPQLAAAPPVGTRGEMATTARAVGAHLAHLQGGTLSNGIACSECHPVPTSMLHANGTVAMAWGPLATTRASAPVWTPSTSTCSSNWCHGAKLTGGTDTTPIWTKVDGTQDACGTCHGRPPPSGKHGESEHRVSCGYCHAPAYTTTAVDKVLHVDGAIQVQGSRIRTWNPTTHSCLPTCHGTETW